MHLLKVSRVLTLNYRLRAQSFISVKDEDKSDFIGICQTLFAQGFNILATKGTTRALNAAQDASH